jgi:hypothetical protein
MPKVTFKKDKMTIEDTPGDETVSFMGNVHVPQNLKVSEKIEAKELKAEEKIEAKELRASIKLSAKELAIDEKAEAAELKSTGTTTASSFVANSNATIPTLTTSIFIANTSVQSPSINATTELVTPTLTATSITTQDITAKKQVTTPTLTATTSISAPSIIATTSTTTPTLTAATLIQAPQITATNNINTQTLTANNVDSALITSSKQISTPTLTATTIVSQDITANNRITTPTLTASSITTNLIIPSTAEIGTLKIKSNTEAINIRAQSINSRGINVEETLTTKILNVTQKTEVNDFTINGKMQTNLKAQVSSVVGKPVSGPAIIVGNNNAFVLLGTDALNYIETKPANTILMVSFYTTCTVNNNVASLSTGYSKILLEGNANKQFTAKQVLLLISDGSNWKEVQPVADLATSPSINISLMPGFPVNIDTQGCLKINDNQTLIVFPSSNILKAIETKPQFTTIILYFSSRITVNCNVPPNAANYLRIILKNNQNRTFAASDCLLLRSNGRDIWNEI